MKTLPVGGGPGRGGGIGGAPATGAIAGRADEGPGCGLGVNATAGGVTVGLGVPKVGETQGRETGDRSKCKKSGESGVGGDRRNSNSPPSSSSGVVGGLRCNLKSSSSGGDVGGDGGRGEGDPKGVGG